MRLEQLHYLIEISHTQSISLAAEKLFITQPTLSIAISSLEKELGVKLLERTKSGVYPTPQGQKVIQLAQEILSKLDDIFTICSPPAIEDSEINIFTIPSINCGLLQQTLISLHQDYPHIQANITEEKPAIAFSAFSKRYLHLEQPRYFGIFSAHPTMIQKFQQSQSKNIVIEFLGSDEMVCYVSSTSPLAQNETISSQDFLHYPLIKYQFSPSNPTTFIKDPLSTIGKPSHFASLYSIGNVLLSVSTLETLKKLVAANMGITSMPGAIVYNDQAYLEGQIKLLRFSDISMPLHYYLIYSGAQPLTAAETAFVAHLRQIFIDARSHLTPNE